MFRNVFQYVRLPQLWRWQVKGDWFNCSKEARMLSNCLVLLQKQRTKVFCINMMNRRVRSGFEGDSCFVHIHECLQLHTTLHSLNRKFWHIFLHKIFTHKQLITGKFLTSFCRPPYIEISFDKKWLQGMKVLFVFSSFKRWIMPQCFAIIFLFQIAISDSHCLTPKSKGEFSQSVSFTGQPLRIKSIEFLQIVNRSFYST